MYNELKIKKMETNYQEIADLVARKCQEALAPLYEELHELQVQPKEEEMLNFSEDVAILKNEGLIK
ncbi:MAG: hypothetical protein IIV72_02795 [Alistipes sp.]|nr:hypothetical protein [Alistipes sp.]